jgi:hypothetical protein
MSESEMKPQVNDVDMAVGDSTKVEVGVASESTTTTESAGVKRGRDAGADEAATPAGGNRALPSFRLVVSNAGKNVHREKFKKMLDTMIGSTKYRNSKKNISDHAGFVTFFNQDDLEAALPLLRKGQNKFGEGLIVEIPAPKKRKVLASPSEGAANDADADPEQKCVADAVTPWHAVPYVDQLARKQYEIFRALKRSIRNLRKTMGEYFWHSFHELRQPTNPFRTSLWQYICGRVYLPDPTVISLCLQSSPL